MEHVAANPIASLAYLIAGVCFILALRGLSSPTSSQRGNRFGMIGMTIAVVTTLVTHMPLHHVNVDFSPMAGIPEGARSLFLPDYATIIEILAAIGIGAGGATSKWLGLGAVVLASVNIFGGFAVTARMLAMYKKKERPAVAKH